MFGICLMARSLLRVYAFRVVFFRFFVVVVVYLFAGIVKHWTLDWVNVRQTRKQIKANSSMKSFHSSQPEDGEVCESEWASIV